MAPLPAGLPPPLLDGGADWIWAEPVRRSVRFAPSRDPLFRRPSPEPLGPPIFGELIEASARLHRGGGPPGSGGIVFDGDGEPHRRH